MLPEIVETYLIPAVLRILLAIVVWIAGRWLARRTRVWLGKSLEHTELTGSLTELITTVSYYGVLLLTVLVALGVLGVPVTALSAAAGVSVVVLAIALQESLGNLAGTVLILLFKPFKLGDIVEAGGALGVVDEIQMFSTVLSGPDGKTHVVPNGKMQDDGLTNHSTAGWLRLSLSFGVSYDSDLAKAKTVLANLLLADERVLSDPPPRVFVHTLGDSSVELVAWPVVKTSDAAGVTADIVEQAVGAFEASGIVLPNPQQDVHLYSHN